MRFEITEPLGAAVYCHCTRCQRRTGTSASASARLAPGSLTLLAGADLVHAWEPPDGWAKLFCSRCGSALFSRSNEDPGRMSVRLGAVAGDPGVRPDARQFVAYAAAWEPIPDDGLTRWPEVRGA